MNYFYTTIISASLPITWIDSHGSKDSLFNSCIPYVPITRSRGKKKSQIASNLLLQETVVETVIQTWDWFIDSLDFNAGF